MASSRSSEATVSEQRGDDLTRISGVGPVVAGRLADAGIRTFHDIVSSTPEDLARALSGLPGCTADRIRAGDWIGQARRLGGTTGDPTETSDDEREPDAGSPLLRVVRLGRARIRPVHDASRSDQPTAVGLELRPGPRAAPVQVVEYSAAISARRLDADGEILIANVGGVMRVDRGISHSAAGPALEAGLYRLMATIRAQPAGHDPDAPAVWSHVASGDLIQVVTPTARGGRPAKLHQAGRRLRDEGVISDDEYAELQTSGAPS